MLNRTLGYAPIGRKTWRQDRSRIVRFEKEVYIYYRQKLACFIHTHGGEMVDGETGSGETVDFLRFSFVVHRFCIIHSVKYILHNALDILNCILFILQLYTIPIPVSIAIDILLFCRIVSYSIIFYNILIFSNIRLLCCII